MVQTLSNAQARRIALAAQGLHKPRQPLEIGRRQIGKTVDRLNLLQIDSVSVLVRAHYMPLFSRLGIYAPSELEDAARGRKRLFFEYWAHEASFLPVALWPLLQWRMRRAERGDGIYGGLARFGRERADLIEKVFDRVEKGGPLAASELEGERGSGGWWGWSDTKKAFEWLFWAGRLTAAHRRSSFERVYDLPERALPRAVIEQPVPNEADAQRALLALSARAHGVATESCLRDYFRLGPAESRARLAELVEDGTLVPVEVRGWNRPAFLHKDAKLPRRGEGRALLSPFDPLVWERARAESLFDFRYRLEIYTPAAKRQFGYYVLPFLLRDSIAARVDLKADRAAKVLRVLAAHAEREAPADTAHELAAELDLMRQWLNLDGIEVEPRGDLAASLAEAMRLL
ncbi:MAG: cytoplasmic protein [Mesorhizobium amorphae]|nr:MAG: cytoplasmic protein [Mesorhizobium amorphae]